MIINLEEFSLLKLLWCAGVAFPFFMMSCGIQNSHEASNSKIRNDKSFYCRIRIKLESDNINKNNVLAVLENNSPRIALNQFYDPGARSSLWALVIYIEAPTNEVNQLRYSLFEVGASGIDDYKVNHN